MTSLLRSRYMASELSSRFALPLLRSPFVLTSVESRLMASLLSSGFKVPLLCSWFITSLLASIPLSSDNISSGDFWRVSFSLETLIKLRVLEKGLSLCPCDKVWERWCLWEWSWWCGWFMESKWVNDVDRLHLSPQLCEVHAIPDKCPGEVEWDEWILVEWDSSNFAYTDDKYDWSDWQVFRQLSNLLSSA